MSKPRIIVTVNGGVADVLVPPNTIPMDVVVVDYDVEGEEEDYTQEVDGAQATTWEGFRSINLKTFNRMWKEATEE